MNPQQLNLFEQRKRQLDHDVAILTSHLYLRQCWQTREQLTRALGWTERRVRAAGEASGGVIVFGQKGVIHIKHATVDEIKACVNTLYSQARKNTHRAVEIQRQHHAWGRKAEAFA